MIIQTRQPELLGDSKWLRREADTHCPNSTTIGEAALPVYCGVPIMVNVVFDGDHPPADMKLEARCWSCGQLFHISWELQPVWSSFTIKETADK